MRQRPLLVVGMAAVLSITLVTQALADPVVVGGGGYEGEINTGITLPGTGTPGGGSGSGGGGASGASNGGGSGSSGTGGSGGGGGSGELGLGGLAGAVGGMLSCTAGETVATNPLCPADPAAPGAPAAPPPPNPAQMAQDLRADMVQKLPQPSMTLSPDLPNTFNAEIGYPITFVNLWTWFWASPEVWEPVSDTLTLGGVTVTTTATPISLSFDPGTGEAEVVCPRQGRAWVPADDVVDPSTVGGCGHMYTSVTPDPISATLSVQWLVTWTVNGAPGGTLAPLETTIDTPEFVVAQVRVMHR